MNTIDDLSLNTLSKHDREKKKINMVIYLPNTPSIQRKFLLHNLKHNRKGKKEKEKKNMVIIATCVGNMTLLFCTDIAHV